MKNTYCKSLFTVLLSFFLCSQFRLSAQVQSYDKLWKEVETLQKKDLPRSVIKQVNGIYEKARKEKNVPQLLKAHLIRVSQQVALTPDSAEVEVERLKAWAERESDEVTAAFLYHLLGNVAMQKSSSDWQEAMRYYRRALASKELLLNTSAAAYVPVTEISSFSERFFQDNVYDLLVRQTIAGLMSHWQWRQDMEIQDWIVDLYDSLIEGYTVRGNRTAAMLSHEAKILFLNQYSVADKYRIDAEQAEKALKDLLKLYESQPAMANAVTSTHSGVSGEVVAADALVDVRLKLADKLSEQQLFVEAMEVLQQTRKSYPKTSLDKELQSKMEWIQHPSLDMDIPLVYPLHNVPLAVSYKNITGVKIETFKLPFTAQAPELYGKLTNEMLCNNYGKKIDSQTFRLPATTNYQLRVEKVAYRLPDKGIYVVKATPVGRKGKADYQLLFVSPYQCLTIPVSDNEVEVVAVDRLTGNPVPYAEVVVYPSNPSYGKNTTVTPNVWRTNQKGSVILKDLKHETKYIHVRTAGNDFMKISPLYARGNYRTTQNAADWQPLTVLFTDRSLYRPGQIIHVSGVRYEQQADSMRTSVSKVMNVQLIDSNGKQVGEQSATTDAFGVFSVDFTLPQHILPGYFTLRTQNKAVSIRVENYKRPTFDVTFTPVSQTYTFGDSLTVSGTSQTFAGAPVRLAKGTYRIIRSEAWLWLRTGNEKEIASGTFTTDASGKFAINLSLLPPPSVKSNFGVPYYIYKVKADVTSGAGETQAGELSLSVGKESIGLHIEGLPQQVAREKQSKIQFQVMNLNKQLVQTEVTYQVYAVVGENPSQAKAEPYNQASGRTSNHQPAGKLVLEGKNMAQQSFVPTSIYALPSGKYQLKISARDEQGRLASTSQEFILFSLADKQPPVETTEWFYQDGTSLADGKTISLYLGSSKQRVYALMDIFRADKRIRSERFYLNNSIRKFDFRYDESYGDGLIVSLTFLRDGRLYTKQVHLERPKPQKELTMKWESFRNQLTPGQPETWRMKITDRSGNPVNANLLAALYDASLDKLYAHNWWYQPYFNRFMPYVGIRVLAHATSQHFYVNFPSVANEYGYALLNGSTYSRLLPLYIYGRPYYSRGMNRVAGIPVLSAKSSGNVLHDAASRGNSFDVEETDIVFEEEKSAQEISYPSNESSSGTTVRPLRTNFSETAFYYPMLRTHANGEVNISFTLPDALTEWKFMGFAHTQEMDYGLLTDKVTASKPFMVQPNLPRFVRVGDHSTLAVSLVNLSMETVEGQMRMELINPQTNQIIFTQKQKFAVAEGKTGVAQFSYKLLDNYDVLICRVVAEAGEFSDGEQHYLPVLTDKEWITETIPFQVSGNHTCEVSLEGLFNSNSSTATQKRLTVELTANPSWYVVQALPVIGNPTTQDAISWSAAYYANTLAATMVQNNPHIQQVFQTWLSSENNSRDALWSNLEKNPDLKNLLLQETPWLAEAQTETEQKHRVALLFEYNGVKQRLQLAAQQLIALQTPEGGWTWYPGMPVSRYTTTQVMELMARLKSMNIPMDPLMINAYRSGLNYLKEEVKKEYEHMIQAKKEIGVTSLIINYLYICSLDKQAQQSANQKHHTYFLDRLLHGSDLGRKGSYSIYGKSYTIAEKARMATIMHANGRLKVAATLLQSIKEYLVSTPEMGTYFDTYKATYSWNSYRIPTHVAAMEAIRRIQPDEALLNGMKQWLLKQKQVQVWNTPLATVDAIYAFLLTDETNTMSRASVKASSEAEPGHVGKMKATWGNTQVITPNDALGYTRKTFLEDSNRQNNSSGEAKGSRVGSPSSIGQPSRVSSPSSISQPTSMDSSSSMDKIFEVKNLQVSKEGNGIGWGAVYAQYLEQMDKVKGASTDKSLTIRREYRLNDQNQVVRPETTLKVGDKVTVRLLVKADRDMDFVSIKDQRAACMEPVEQLSGYSWNAGLSTYRVNRDASTEYFIDKLPKGKYVIEYAVYVNRVGVYQTGSATIQSVYAPEFSSHTGGVMVKVE